MLGWRKKWCVLSKQSRISRSFFRKHTFFVNAQQWFTHKVEKKKERKKLYSWMEWANLLLLENCVDRHCHSRVRDTSSWNVQTVLVTICFSVVSAHLYKYIYMHIHIGWLWIGIWSLNFVVNTNSGLQH